MIPTTKERLAALEKEVKLGFEYIKDILDNHLKTHSRRETRLTTTIITLAIGIKILIIKTLIFN